LSDPATFEQHLLKNLGISKTVLEDYIRGVRTYRDKFVAHLDSDPLAKYPMLDIAIESAKVLLEYLHSEEDKGKYLVGLPSDGNRLYKGTMADARTHYAHRIT
jgi:hypothetical protein